MFLDDFLGVKVFKVKQYCFVFFPKSKAGKFIILQMIFSVVKFLKLITMCH